jgi:micrococcal nuclease
MRFIQGVSLADTPFVLCGWLIAFLLACGPAQTHAGDCPAVRASERVEVSYVYDGDTVKLADGRKLRFIGINTPEIGRHGEPNQPFAAQARAFLGNLLKEHGHILTLQPGTEAHDHYGRLLAHAFLETGENVGVQLLDTGLATTVVIPPDTWAADCYQRHEDKARAARLGLWSLPAYQPQESARLPRDAKGFRIVRGRVMNVHHTRYAVLVALDGSLHVRVPSKDLSYFKPRYLDNLKGRNVEVRGWIKTANDGLRVNVRHPAAIRAVGADSSRSAK